MKILTSDFCAWTSAHTSLLPINVRKTSLFLCWSICLEFSSRTFCGHLVWHLIALGTCWRHLCWRTWTCSALETFSDSGLYKFSFYITLH